MLEVGSLVDGKYKILSKIGQGGMSNVYMAINEKANKTWAIKEMRKSGIVDFESVKQGLVTETNILKSLKHPNLPSIVDVLEDEESFLIVMDYIEGNSLRQILQEHGTIPQKYVVSWAKILCDVLLYLHGQDSPIIYRDMKPGNIMLKPDGSLMLIDFGTAREFKVKNRGDTVCLGTVGYAAPEQFGGMGQTDARTDIYGLGATMYHLLTGNNPGKPPYEMKRVRQMNPSLSGGLEKIIEKCTQKNPKDRYQSAAELMYALEHYEEQDSAYRNGQKKHLLCFLLSVVFMATSFLGGCICTFYADRESNVLYQKLLDEAAKAIAYEKKLEFFDACMDIPGKSGEVSAYLGLIQAYKENDMAFTNAESSELMKYIQKNKRELQKNVDNYVQICFEVGKLYWYYFVEDDGSVNQAVRGKYAEGWFQDAIRYATKEYEYLNMAKVYARIGMFYRDIALDIIEANDKGKYVLLYRDIQELLSSVAEDEQESEIVRLELLAFSQNAMLQYAVKFRQDGVTKQELEEVLQMISRVTAGLVTTTEKTEQKKRNIIAFLEDTKNVVERTFTK